MVNARRASDRPASRRQACGYWRREPARLGKHWSPLRPRCDHAGELLRLELVVNRPHAGCRQSLDADGNLATAVRFAGERSRLAGHTYGAAQPALHAEVHIDVDA